MSTPKEAPNPLTPALSPKGAREKALPIGTVTVETAGPDYAAEFANVRKFNRMAQISAAQSAAFQILCGVELNRLKKTLGFEHGGKRKGDQAATRCRLKFSELAEQHGGVSERMGRNYCAMATAAKKRVPMLSAPEMLDTPLSQQPRRILGPLRHHPVSRRQSAAL